MMERDGFKYRKFARGVAVAQLVLNSLAILLLTIFGIALTQETVIEFARETSKFNNGNGTAASKFFSDHNELRRIWIVFISVALLVGLKTLANAKLLKATKVGAVHEIALRQAKIWRIAMILFTLLVVISSSWYINLSWWAGATGVVLLHGVFIAIGWKYIDELEGAAAPEAETKPPTITAEKV